MQETELILGNSNPRFSGVTSTMLQVLPYQQEALSLAVMGGHHLPGKVRCLSFFQAAKLCRDNLPHGSRRVFHARRNDEVIQALLLKWIFRAKIRIVFTATSQRRHSWITRFLVRQCDAVITTCSGANRFIAEYRDGGADVIIPHGIDTGTYQPAETKEKAWQKLGLPGKYGIGIFGRVRHQKGVDILVDSILPLLKKHPDFTVVVCGAILAKDEEYLAALKVQIASYDLSDRFIFMGEQPFTEVPQIIRAMSIVAALSRNEGYGLTVPEAMASGCAVLASEAGAWKDIVRDGADGYVVPCDDVDATREKLDLMMSSPDNLASMGAAGRKHILENFTIEEEAERLCEFLQSVTHNASN